MDLAEKVPVIDDVDEYDEEDSEYTEEEVEQEVKGGVLEAVVNGVEELKQVDNGVPSSQSEPGKVFVGGVAWETTDESFSNHFKKYGEVVDSVIMKDKHTQAPRGFGFVTFADPSIIDKMLEDDHVIDGRTVEVKKTVPREDTSSKGRSKTKKIFVGGIPTSLTEDELKVHFSSYGEVVEHHIMMDRTTGRSRGFAFVTFESEETVDRIISMGRMQDLGGKQVEIKIAEPKRNDGETKFKGRTGYSAGSGHSYGFGVGAYEYEGRAGGSHALGYGYGAVDYGSGFGFPFGGPMYGAGRYGVGNVYGALGAYGGAYAGYNGSRGYGSRYHPYGR